MKELADLPFLIQHQCARSEGRKVPNFNCKCHHTLISVFSRLPPEPFLVPTATFRTCSAALLLLLLLLPPPTTTLLLLLLLLLACFFSSFIRVVIITITSHSHRRRHVLQQQRRCDWPAATSPIGVLQPPKAKIPHVR